MTIFIASLFLPYTVNFDTSQDNAKVNDVEESRSQTNNVHNGYFSVPVSTTASKRASLSIPLSLSIPFTPGATTAIEKMFIPDDTSRKVKMSLPSSRSSTSLRSLVRPDSQSLTWGQENDGHQPVSRAKSPPPASILKHNAVVVKSPDNMPIRSRKQNRHKTLSHEKKFSHSSYTVEPCLLGNGGLVSAIDAADNSGDLGDKTWVGTIGLPTDVLDEHTKQGIAERFDHDFESLVVWVEDNDLNGHYEHYCKTILWPVLHYQIPDHPKSKAYEDHSWVFYVRVNQAFAGRIAKNWKRGDVIWIHDYHLLLAPGMLRKLLPDAQIGFYLHIAFPSSEVFRCLATRGELLEGLLGANLIGFQIEEHAHHFLQTCSRILNIEATKEGVILEDGRFVHVGEFPAGVDPSTVELRRNRPEVRSWINTISEKYADKKLIVARDKLDNIGGIRQKLLAYEMFLNHHPEYNGKVVLIQIATSTTEDPGLTAAIADIAADINSTHSTLAHQPLVFLRQDIDYSQWLALLTVADCLMITSLREGMNLTGHDFTYCQDGKLTSDKHAPLIVSEFTGCAALLKEGALLVNPWDLKQCSESIRTALDMSVEEKESRWQKMYKVVGNRNALQWCKSYIDALSQAYEDHSTRDVTSVPRLSFGNLKKKYDCAYKRLLFLDYEGTLAARASTDDIAISTPEKAADVLNDLIDDKKNTVYVMSSRAPDELESLFKRVPGLGLLAENGSYLLMAGSSEWIALVDEEYTETWKTSVRSILKYYEERIERSRIEEMNSALIFHYDAAVDKQAAFKQAAECANHINDACRPQKVNAIPMEDCLWISSTEVNKSSAAHLVGDEMLKLNKKKSVPLPEFLLVMGDSRDDEYVFEWAQKMGRNGVRDVVTVAVSQRNTAASCAMTQGVTGVLSTLRKLAGETDLVRNSKYNGIFTTSKREP